MGHNGTGRAEGRCYALLGLGRKTEVLRRRRTVDAQDDPAIQPIHRTSLTNGAGFRFRHVSVFFPVFIPAISFSLFRFFPLFLFLLKIPLVAPSIYIGWEAFFSFYSFLFSRRPCHEVNGE